MSMPNLSLKTPKGYSQFAAQTRGGQSANLYSQLAGGVAPGIPNILSQLQGQATGAPGTFDALEAPALRQFQQQIAPGIASRYAGSGIAGSSGMQNALAGAGANLAQDLQAKRLGIMQDSMHDILNLSNFLLKNPDIQGGLVQNQPKGPSGFEQLLGVGLPMLGAGLGAFGGLPGAKLGGQVGAAASRGLFS